MTQLHLLWLGKDKTINHWWPQPMTLLNTQGLIGQLSLPATVVPTTYNM